MIETIAIILLILWVLGLVSAYTMSGFIQNKWGQIDPIFDSIPFLISFLIIKS